ncbi:MAG: sulfatase-like hydrolase/transferase [Verrucomicrobiota bacterium]
MKKGLIAFVVGMFISVGICFGEADRPNIVFMLVDDMGAGDLSCYGAPDVATPRIDDLAAEGVRFTQFYAMGPECTPSRTAILTGRYPQRAGGMECAIGTGDVGRYDDAIRLAETGDLGLPPEQAVLVPGLKAAGYANVIFGKWHLGYDQEKFSPLDQGFDEFYGFLGGNVDYFRHVELSEIPVMYRDRELAEEREGYMTHLITDDAVGFIEREHERPLFLYVPFSTPHFPFHGPEDDPGGLLPADQWTVGERDAYVRMLVDMDESVGRILDALDAAGLKEDTLVVFASDHGAMVPGINAPFRDYKGTLFEGGIRVPCIARWPGKIPAGVESSQVGTLMDLTVSFLDVAGATVPDGGELDGVDILAKVVAGRADEDRELYWRSKRGERTWWAMRDGDWKYVKRDDGGTVDEWLFELASDEGEARDLRGDNEERLEAMKRDLAEWESQVQAVR